MNKHVLICRNILENPSITQRALAEKIGVSLGTANALIRECTERGYIREISRVPLLDQKQGTEIYPAKKSPSSVLGRELTPAGLAFLEPYRVDCALIFAAGFGSRFVPITYETPKGLVEVFGEPMLERQIRQLHEAGITDITVMVGYLKEKFEYLIDKFGVKLLYNPEYATKNTLATMYHAASVLAEKNCYVLNSDNWLRENLYHSYESGAWYGSAYAAGDTAEWVFLFDKKNRRIRETFPGGRGCWYMYGPAYFSREFTEQFLPVLKYYYQMPGTEQYYWEHVLMEMLNGQAKRRCTAYFGHIAGSDAWKDIEICANCQPDGVIYEFENIEELRRFDDRYNHNSGSEAMQLVSKVFDVPESAIRRIRCLKAGMTNNSWLFALNGRDYICRIPGEGTEKLINRREEKEAYEAVKPLGITDELVYFNAETGYKITVYYENSRVADPKNKADLRACMQKLRLLHESGLTVGHAFDAGERIRYYETLCAEAARLHPGEEPLMFADYSAVRPTADKLLQWLSTLHRPQTIAHIDSVCDNFLFLPGAEISETERDPSRVRLIDWEYCGMCDPLIDVSMCAIYSYMKEPDADTLLELYLNRVPDDTERRVFYAYMALGGLLWALWGIYKEELGVQFTDYTLRMYRYFKDYAPKALGI